MRIGGEGKILGKTIWDPSSWESEEGEKRNCKGSKKRPSIKRMGDETSKVIRPILKGGYFKR